MSWKATAYVKDLQRAPNGQKITISEKLVMFVLADCYNEDRGRAWPSLAKLAMACLMTDRHARRVVRGLEAKGLIQVVVKPGRSRTNEYRFTGYPLGVTNCKSDKLSYLSNSKTGKLGSRNRILEGRKGDLARSGEPQEAETDNNYEQREDKNYLRRELQDMRRNDSVGKFTRKLIRARLEDPSEAAMLPGWFRREVENLLKGDKGTLSAGNSPGAQREK